jgi:anti-sigma regulatory factor (Ser/Thr protein kinase)
MHALTDDAETVTSELVANAVAAVPPGTPGLSVILTVHARPPEVRIHVWDIGPGCPSQATADGDAESGRGLAIIDDLTAHQWGWWPTPASGGKVTWAALTTTAT